MAVTPWLPGEHRQVNLRAVVKRQFSGYRRLRAAGALSTRDLGPGREGLVAKGAAKRRRHFLATGNMEKVGYLIVYRQEFLDLPW